MGAGLTLSTFQESLAKEKVAQQLDPQGGIGAGEPQISGVTIRAMKGNAGIIYIGGSAAEATEGEGFELAAGDALSIDIEGTGKIWFNGTHTGDKICVAGVGP